MRMPRTRPLVAPSYLFDGDIAWICVRISDDRRWYKRGVVTCAAGNSARVAYRDDSGEIQEAWRSLESLRIQQTDPLDTERPDSYEPTGPAFVGSTA